MTRLGLVAAFVLLVAACGGSGEGKEAVPTPGPPPVDPRLTVHAEGVLDLNVAPAASQEIDLEALAEAQDVTIPCASYVFLFSWQVDDDIGLSFTGSRQAGSFAIVSGRSGNASISGCVSIEATNDDADAPVTGTLRYIIAESGQSR